MNRLRFAGIAAAVVAVIGAIFQPAAAVQAYHFAVLVCVQLTLGSLFLILLYQTTGGKWGARILPCLLAMNRLVPWCLFALAPVVIFLPAIYRWAGHPALAGDRAVFLNWPFFAIRCVIYLLAFGSLSRWVGRGRKAAAPGLIFFALIAYFVAVDLVMAIDHKWFSSGFPVVFMSSAAGMALAFAITVSGRLPGATDDPKTWRDLGNLLLAMVVFWSYVAFTQFLIIWSGNLPEEITWYVIRGSGPWKWVTMLLAIFNLFAPFFVLLSRAVKDRPERLRRVSALVLGSQVVYIYWLVAPSFPGRSAYGIHWLDPLVLLAAAAIFTAGFGVSYRKEAGHG